MGPKPMSMPQSTVDLLRRLELAPSPAEAAFALELISRWPWLAREAARAYLAALCVYARHGGAPAALTALRAKAVKGLNPQMTQWRDRALEAAAAMMGPEVKVVPKPASTAPALPVGNPKALKPAWLEVAAARNPADLERLLPSLSTGPGTDISERCVELMRFPPDARIAEAVTGLALRPPVSPDVSGFFWLGVMFALVRHPTAAGADAVKKVSQREDGFLCFEWLIRERAAKSSLPAAPVKKIAGVESEAGWLAQCAQNLDDTSRRLAFADWLSERGDPRGEFIALQCLALSAPLDAAQRKREKQLLTAHRKAWAAPFARFLRAGSDRFRGGFLVALRGAANNPADVPAPGGAPWTFVEELDLMFVGSGLKEMLELLKHPVLGNLRALEGLVPKHLDVVLATPRPKLERLSFELPWATQSVEAPVAKKLKQASFPKLTTLAVRDFFGEPAALEPVFSAPLFAGVREFTTGTRQPLKLWHDAFRSHAVLKKVDRLRWADREGTFACTFARDGSLAIDGGAKTDWGPLLEQLATLRTRGLTLTVAEKVPAAQKKALLTAAAR